MLVWWFQSVPYTQNVIHQGLARETDLYFSGVIERGSGKAPQYAIIRGVTSTNIWGRFLTDEFQLDIEPL